MAAVTKLRTRNRPISRLLRRNVPEGEGSASTPPADPTSNLVTEGGANNLVAEGGGDNLVAEGSQ